MGLWIEILKLGAEGKAGDARNLLAKIPEELTGRVRGSVKRFINTLSADWQALGILYEEDLVDSIVTDVALSVEETLLLVELVQQPEASVDHILSVFPWKERLKRSADQKRKRIADYLHSIGDLGVDLPPAIQSMVAEEGESVFDFDETKYATSTVRVRRSWDGLKNELGLDTELDTKDPETGKKIYGRLISIDDSESNTMVAAEQADYGRIYIRSVVEYPPGTIYELHQLGEQLGPEVTEIMERMHAAKPKQGFRPISWHYVFWILSEEYENLLLQIRCLEPLCRTEDGLAEHLSQHHRDVVGTSRSTITRRRDRLYRACEDRIQERMRDRFRESDAQAPS
jgi:hypothetical protein